MERGESLPVKVQSVKLADAFRYKRNLVYLAAAIAFFFGLASISAYPAFAQSASSRRPLAKLDEKHTSPAEAEIAKRIEAANAARVSGDPARVALASDRLIGLSLREMGQLRLLESAFPQAVELYRRSLDFEDLPDTRIDLAIAELQAGRLDDAIAASDQALAADSNNPRGYLVRGRALMRKQDFAKAAQALSHAVRLKPDIESLYSLGICLLATTDAKDKQRAAVVFQKMIDLAGDSGSLHVLFGRAYRDAEDMPASIRELQRAIQLDPRTPHVHYFLGLARLSLNEWKPIPEAKSELLKEVEYYPHDFLANYMVGFIASSERQYAEAERYLKVATEVNPSWPEPWLYMGLNAYAQGDMKRAEEILRKAVLLTGTDESRSNYQIRRAYVDLGRILTNSARVEEAEVFLTKARELQNKTMEQSQQSVASVALAGGAGAAAAVVPLNPQHESEAAPLLPANTDPFARVDASVMARADLTEKQRSIADSQENRLRTILGVSFNDLATSEAVRGQFVEALSHYQEAEHWNGAIQGLQKNLGQCAFRTGNYSEAIRGLSKSLEENPADAPVRAMLGMAYFATDKFSDAVKTFSPLGLRGMQDPVAGYAWAASLARTSELKRASEVLERYEKGNLPGDTLVLVGQLWTEIGDYARAVAVLQGALQANASLPKAHYYSGLAYIRWEHWPEAAGEFQAELAIAPTDPDAKYNLGFVFLQLSKVDEAVELFQQVVAAHPDYANAQYQLGKILLDRGQVKEAVAHLEMAARVSPGTDYVHYQLQAAYRRDSRMADADRELQIYKELKAKSRERATPPPIQNP
jgi:tetratricopeptide (TPR) repeat protein